MAEPAVTETLETRDIQALVRRGYGKLQGARFLLLRVRDAERARGYLRELCGRVDRASHRTPDLALQVAFTAPGLAALGVPDSALASFSREFLEGMDDDVRAESLGDRGVNDPSTWEWGRGRDVHVLVMIYAPDDDVLEPHVTRELGKLAASGLDVVRQQHTLLRDDQKEHFGWRDGLSMPNIEGVPPDRPRGKDQPSWTGPIKPGEFVLGYPNEYGCLTERPTADPADDPAGHLPATADGRKDLGRNGTYLVYREMTQDVHRLWRYLAESSREPGSDVVERAVALGAKMVGRWPGGAPLITSPTADLAEHANDNEFVYSQDLAGMRCPIGAHIRRASPRDVLGSDHTPGDSEIMVRKHQMIRRGRAFGARVTETLAPRELIEAPPDDVRRGLHFICLVGHISRQFEFVQRAWIHSANFGGLFKDGDPITAARRPAGHPNPNDELTCPALPVRRKYKAMPQFTRLVGGAYFFLPGVRALKFIARHP